MKFGVNFFPSFRPHQITMSDYFAQCLRVAEAADRLGFNSVKTVEHYFNDYGSCPNPIVLLSAIAARTRRIRLVTGAVIPAFNHPIKLAGELAMLDNISGGRLDIGVGRAFIPEEYAAYGLDMADSRVRFDDSIETTGSQQCRVDLIERLLAFVIGVADSVSALTTDSVDFIYENDARCALPGFIEQIAHATCSDLDEHFDEFGPGDPEKRYARFARHGAREECFSRPRWT